ncbi:ComF family protein [Solidesulfovibrio sp.]|uniref:ComF family protein n=1 Tax=Solidesulfovibrio sp. TaxID=2910990 RepID=UPI0026362414|nr:ComF family protein [Solidesulfovibrio sp.]
MRLGDVFAVLGRGLGRSLTALCGRCQACAGLLPAAAAGELPLCPACAARLAPRLGGHCPRCGELAEDPGGAPTTCLECRRQGRSWDGFAFHGPYDDLLRELILGFKFHGRLAQGRLLAGLALAAYRRAAGREGEGAMDPDGPGRIVPVPLHPRRLAWRGFNQSLELSRLLAVRLGRPVAMRALCRIRDTTPQSQLPGARRRANIAGAFAADPGQVEGRSVLLVDDVMTTGATIDAAADALRRAGAVRVDVLVVAR